MNGYRKIHQTRERLRFFLVLADQPPVLDFAGTFDVVPFEWRYEVDAPEPYSIRIRWEVRGVYAVERPMPPLWRSEVLDMSIIY